MLTIYRRHLKSCPHTSRSYRRCACPIWVQGTLGHESVRRALDVTSFEAASKLVNQWHAAGSIRTQHVEAARIQTAVMKYLDDARARHLAEGTLSKLTTVFEKQLLQFAKDHGYRI